MSDTGAVIVIPEASSDTDEAVDVVGAVADAVEPLADAIEALAEGNADIVEAVTDAVAPLAEAIETLAEELSEQDDDLDFVTRPELDAYMNELAALAAVTAAEVAEDVVDTLVTPDVLDDEQGDVIVAGDDATIVTPDVAEEGAGGAESGGKLRRLGRRIW